MLKNGRCGIYEHYKVQSLYPLSFIAGDKKGHMHTHAHAQSPHIPPPHTHNPDRLSHMRPGICTTLVAHPPHIPLNTHLNKTQWTRWLNLVVLKNGRCAVFEHYKVHSLMSIEF